MEVLFQSTLVFLLVFLNGYFVASEFALVAVRKTRVAELAKKGNMSAKLLLGALERMDMYISATQLGITLASLALGWVGEPFLARLIEPFFSFLPNEQAVITSHTLAVAVAFGALTFLHIVLGELVPKSLALQKSERTSLLIVSPLLLFTNIFRPAIWFLNGTGQIILRIFGLHNPQGNQSVYSEEEIKMLLTQSGKSGQIPQKEVEMVYNVFQLGDILVKTVMVPRTDIIAFNVATPLSEILKKIARHPHSRFPVFENTIDNVIGFVHIKDVYRELFRTGNKVKLTELKIIREIISVPEMKKIDSVLQEMRRKRIHLAIVNDEYGGTAGIATLEDILESVVGEIEDEFDQPLQDITRQKDGSYLVEGRTHIDNVREKFKLPLRGQGYTTIGGLVFGLLGHEPQVGDIVQISDLHIEVKQIRGKRIKLLKIKRETRKKKKS
ncbi:MAG: HlyC/CorC family transporter [Candidatus Levybacteria bacterium]|nr:HlyC/CorC family transporter [Candidatus Levybacteria bacterium]